MPPGFPPEALVEVMVDNFFAAARVHRPGYEQLSPGELHRKVILASIVEREYRVESGGAEDRLGVLQPPALQYWA